MENTKYGKYFVSKGINFLAAEKFNNTAYPNFTLNQKFKETFPEASIAGNGVVYYNPHLMVKEVHIHDFDEYLFFLGTNPADMNDFDAEIEINMGEEGEIYVIKSPTILYVPAGLKHCPLNFKVINKPVFFFHIRALNTDKSK